jgi:hypothetical protein
MANRYAVATGNWSDTATWDGGTLPQAGDVVRPNGFTVTIDQDVTVTELRNNAAAPAVAGGSFTLNSAGRTITATSAIAQGTVNLINASYGGGLSTIISPAIGSVSTAAEAVSVIGLAGGQLLVIGNLTGAGTGFGDPFNCGVTLEGNGQGFQFELIGNTNGGGTSFGAGLGIGSGYNVTVTGNVTGTAGGFAGGLNSPGVYLIGASSTLTVNGIVSNANQPGITIVGSLNTVILNGVVQSNGVHNAVYNATAVSANNKVVLGNVSIVNHDTAAAVLATNVQLLTTSSVTYQYVTSPTTNKSLFTADLLTGYPPEAKVEDGEVYGPSGEFTGELSPVVVNTAQLATDLFDAIIASSDPLAVRLKNTATVSTVNDAIGSLNVIP